MDISERRTVPIRRLTAAEAELVEYEPPLVLSRIERRVLFLPWRPTGWYAVVNHQQEILMALKRKELDALGIPTSKETE